MRYAFLIGDATTIPLADKSVDLVFGSPPYEAQRTYGIGFNLRGQDWVDFMVKVFRECLRVCRGLVAMVLEGFTRQYRWSASPAMLMADLHRAGIHLRKPPVFHRVGIPGSGGPDWLRNDFEFVVCATNGGKLPWSDNTAKGHKPKWGPGGEMSHRITDGRRVNQWGAHEKGMGGERQADGSLRIADAKPSHKFTTVRNQWGGTAGQKSGNRKRDGHRETYIRKSHDYAGGVEVKANPGNVIRCKVGGGLMGHALAHENEAPFPETLPDFFIRSFCPPDGLVLDPFNGSGTTVAAAVKAGRRGIGMDIRESQIAISKRRLESIAPLFTGGAA